MLTFNFSIGASAALYGGPWAGRVYEVLGSPRIDLAQILSPYDRGRVESAVDCLMRARVMNPADFDVNIGAFFVQAPKGECRGFKGVLTAAYGPRRVSSSPQLQDLFEDDWTIPDESCVTRWLHPWEC